jgi:hypothetical protein
MCLSRTKLSWRDILNLGVGKQPVAEVAAQKSGCIEVYSPTDNARQLFLHRKEVEAGGVSVFKFHDHVDVTIRPKIVAKNRAEERKPANVMPSAEIANAVPGYFDFCTPHFDTRTRHILSISRRDRISVKEQIVTLRGVLLRYRGA